MHAYPAGGSTGDDEAFVALCEQHRARLVAYCARRVGTHEAEDAAHEVLLRAHRAFATFDASRDSWPWLRTIALRVCTDMQRKAARVSSAAVVDKPATEDVHEQMAARLRAEIVDDALEQLSPRYRSALVLREFGGWSYDDIAHIQGRSRASVRSILTRGRRRLSAHVESVARSRREWPLPGTVPPLQRLRHQLRSWRTGLERSGHAFGAALELSSVGSRLLLGGPAMASILTFSTGGTVDAPAEGRQAQTIASLHQPSPGDPSAIEPPAAPVSLPSTTANAAVTVPSAMQTETFARFSASSVVQSDSAGVEPIGSAEVYADHYHLWVMAGNDEPIAGTNIPCAHRAVTTLACAVVVPVLRALPEL